MTKRVLLLAVAVAAAFSIHLYTSSANTRAPADVSPSRIARMLALHMPLRHLSREPLGDSVSTNTLDIFLTSLDFERIYFLESDVSAFSAYRADLDDKLKAGDIDFAQRVYDVFKQRVENRVAFVKTLLAEGIDTASTNTFQWKRREAPWVATEAEWDDLWRRKIQHEYIGRLVAKQLGSEEAAAGIVEPEETNTASAVDAKLSPEEQIRKSYDRFLTILRDNDEGWLLERYLNAFTHAYDPHTDYMSPNNMEDFEIGMKLSLEGIGALLGNDEGAARVERLIPGGPAERDGRLKPGDRIIAVAQGDEPPVDILHWPLSKAVRLIRGEKGTKVVLTVLPASDPTGSRETRIDLVRDEVKLEEQAAKGEIRTVTGPDGFERKIGVITLPEFYADLNGARQGKPARSSSRDVAELVDELRDAGAEGLILDLRNNGGGSLSDAVQMTGLFIESGPVVQVRDQRRVHTLSDPDPDIAYDGPLIVLVNRLSASASEILAGALQDYGRAIIVGDHRTHGKGTVQTLTPLSNTGADLGSLKVTTASFYRIGGGSTQLRGVESDILLPSPMNSMEIGEDQLPHAMPWSKIDPAFYEPQTNLASIIPELRTRSATRQGSDPKFAAYTNLLSRLDERQKSTTISLNLEERLQLARDEKALQKELESTDITKQDADKKAKNDLVLNESLQILCDWISIFEHDDGPNAATASPAS